MVDPIRLIMPDPELVLPDDPMPAGTLMIDAVSAFFGGTYRTLKGLVHARTEAEAKLNAHMTDAQRSIVPPCNVVAVVLGVGPLMYGHVPSNEQFIEAAHPDPSAQRRIEDLNRRGWLFGHWHSVLCPEGEWGANHRMQVVRLLDEAELQIARMRGWPANDDPA